MTMKPSAAQRRTCRRALVDAAQEVPTSLLLHCNSSQARLFRSAPRSPQRT